MSSNPMREGDPALKSRFFSRTCLIAAVAVMMIAVTGYVLINDSDSSVAEAETSGSCGDELTWSFDPGTGTLTISGTDRMYDYSPGSTPWADKDVISVIMNDGITSIGDFSFFYCESLESISMPSTVKSIGMGAFIGCTGLTSVTIGNGVTAISNNAFYGCTSLASIDVEEGNTAYSSVNGVLFNKDRTEICQYPAGKTDTVYTIPDSVTTIRMGAFIGCTGLTSVTLGNGVESIEDRVFGDCSSLTTITLPASVTSLGFDIFIGCTSLTAINVDEENSYFASVDGVLFSKNLEKLIKYPCGKADATYNIPETTTSIEYGSFEGSIHLKSVTIPKSVTMIYPAFTDCPALVSINVDKDNEEYSSEDGVLFCCYDNDVKDHLYVYPEAKAETTYTIPAFVKEIEAFAFTDSNLKEVVFSEDASVKLQYDSFHNCLELETIIIDASAELDFDERAFSIDEGKHTIRVYSDTKIPANALRGDITLLYMRSVTYDANGGSSDAPTQADVAEGAKFIVASYSGTKTGFTFDGWNDGSKDYAAGSEYTMGESDVVLTAVWKESSVDTHTVTYDVDGGSADAPTQAAVAEGAKFTVASYSGTKDGFIFGGWNDGSKDYAAGSEYTMGASDVVLTAVWTSISHSVTYDVNGGSAAAPTQADVAEGAKFTVASYSGTKTGFTFGGWNDGSKDYAASSEYTMGVSDVVLTAVWTPITHTVTYDVDGGSATAPTQADVAEGAKFTVASYSGTKTGFTFGGWNDGSKDYAAGSEYTMGTSDVVLKAVWKEPSVDTYTVTFNANGGTCATATKTTDAQGRIDALPEATRSGYTINGWFTSAEGGEKVELSRIYTANTTVYAQWTEIVVPTHPVTYVVNGGSAAAPTQAAVAEGTKFTVASYSGTKDGFTFGGWNDGFKDYAAGSEYTMGVSAVVLTAVWNAVPVETSGSCGDDLTWSFDPATGVLTITGTGTMWDFDETTVKWGGNAVKSVVIEDSVTSIGNNAFKGCSSIDSITLGNGVKTIGNNAFNGCTGLTSIDIPDSVTTIGDGVFNGCTGLTSVTLGHGVKTIGDNAFNGCTGLTSIDIPDSVTNLGDGVFNGCTGLTSIDIPDSVTTIGDNAFKGCTGLKSVTLGNGITTLEKGMFADCPDLDSVALGNGITAIEEGVFSGITSLKSVTIGNGVKTIGDNAFNGCTGLTSIDIPDSVTTIGKGAFFGCTGLTSVTIGNGVTTIGDNAFNGCTSLASIDVEEGNTAYSSVNGVLYNKDRTEICQYPAGKTDAVYTIPDSVTSLGDNAFNGCTGLTSVTIGNGVTTISDNAFNGCTSLTSIEVDGDNPAFSSSDGYLLNKAGDELLVCPAGLESATVGNGITKVSEGAFSGDKLKEVVFSGTSVSVAKCAFNNCASLTKIVIESLDVVFEENSITFTDGEKHTLHVVAPKGYQIPNNAMSANVDIVYDGQSSDPDDEGSRTLIGIAIAIVILLALASLVPQITRRP